VIKLSDICAGAICCPDPGPDPCGGLDCLACPEAICSCGLPWDPDRRRHTRSGIRIPDDVYSRILAREGNAIDVEARREADREAIRPARRLVIGGGR
jgi:hypothetical protein